MIIFKITEKDKKAYRLEKDGQNSILKFLKTLRPDGFFFKIHQSSFSKAGISDILGLFKGRFYAFEVKSSTGKPTPLQLVFLACVKKAGGIGGIVRNISDVKTILNQEML